MYRAALLLVFVAVATADQVCNLRDLTTVVNFDPRLWSGAWFEKYFFARRDYNLNDIYEDYTYEVQAQGLDMQIKELTRVTPSAATCSVANDQLRRWEADGKYYYYKAQIGQANVKSWILDTDYNSYAVEFLCYDVRGDVCYDSEVSLWTRIPNDLNQKNLVNQKFHAIFDRASCNGRVGGFNFQRVLEIKHTGHYGQIPYNNVYPNYNLHHYGRCTSLQITYPAGYPYNYNYNYMYNQNYYHDPALIQAQKEMLIADKEKLISEREMLQLMKEQIQLKIDRLRGVIPGGVPK